jgi:hypothetical protein
MPILVLFDDVNTTPIRKRLASLAGTAEHSVAFSGIIASKLYTLFLPSSYEFGCDELAQRAGVPISRSAA